MLEASGAVFLFFEMGKKAKSTQTNQVSWSTPPPTQATTNLQGMVDTPVDYATPIRNQFGRAERELDRSYANPYGAYSTADVKDKAKRSQKFDLRQNLGIALGEAAQQSAGDRFNRQATVAQLTQPRMYGSQSTNAQHATAFDYIQLAGNVAGSVLG